MHECQRTLSSLWQFEYEATVTGTSLRPGSRDSDRRNPINAEGALTHSHYY
jgi:hypothetical protein